jgi:hypothetical protein
MVWPFWSQVTSASRLVPPSVCHAGSRAPQRQHLFRPPRVCGPLGIARRRQRMPLQIPTLDALEPAENFHARPPNTTTLADPPALIILEPPDCLPFMPSM